MFGVVGSQMATTLRLHWFPSSGRHEEGRKRLMMAVVADLLPVIEIPLCIARGKIKCALKVLFVLPLFESDRAKTVKRKWLT